MSIVAIAEGMYNPSIDDLKIINLELGHEAMLEANKNFNKSDAALKSTLKAHNVAFYLVFQLITELFSYNTLTFYILEIKQC